MEWRKIYVNVAINLMITQEFLCIETFKMTPHRSIIQQE